MINPDITVTPGPDVGGTNTTTTGSRLRINGQYPKPMWDIKTDSERNIDIPANKVISVLTGSETPSSSIVYVDAASQNMYKCSQTVELGEKYGSSYVSCQPFSPYNEMRINQINYTNYTAATWTKNSKGYYSPSGKTAPKVDKQLCYFKLSGKLMIALWFGDPGVNGSSNNQLGTNQIIFGDQELTSLSVYGGVNVPKALFYIEIYDCEHEAGSTKAYANRVNIVFPEATNLNVSLGKVTGTFYDTGTEAFVYNGPTLALPINIQLQHCYEGGGKVIIRYNIGDKEGVIDATAAFTNKKLGYIGHFSQDNSDFLAANEYYGGGCDTRCLPSSYQFR